MRIDERVFVLGEGLGGGRFEFGSMMKRVWVGWCVRAVPNVCCGDLQAGLLRRARQMPTHRGISCRRSDSAVQLGAESGRRRGTRVLK